MSEETHPDTKSLHAALFLLADIRRAVGDPTGKLMQDELVAHCGEVYKRANGYQGDTPWQGNLHHDKSPYSDWGMIRDENDRLIIHLRTGYLPESEANEHRRNKTDPTQDRVDFILSRLNTDWQTLYTRLNESLAKNKRLFADEFAEKVIEQQKKRIHQLETELIEAKYQLRKETK